MAKARKKGPSYPRDLLDDVAWSFYDPPFKTQAAFLKAALSAKR